MMKLSNTFATDFARSFKAEPEKFTTINRSRRGGRVTSKEELIPRRPDMVEYDNIDRRDLKFLFPADVLLAWGNPRKVRLIKRNDKPGFIGFVSWDGKPREKGVYTISQTASNRQGSVTTTWVGVGFVAPLITDPAKKRFAFPCSLVGDTFVIDMSELDALP